MSTPCSSSASVTCSQANSSSLREQPPLALDQRDLAPSDWYACAISTPTTPPPRITSALGDLLGGGGLAVGPRRRRSRQALDRRHRRRASRRRGSRPGAPRAPRRRRRRAARRRARRSRGAARCPRSSSHGSCAASSRSWMTSSRRSSTACDVELAGHRLGGAGDAARPRPAPRRGAAAPSTACTPRTSTRRRRAGPRRSRPRARRSASRPAATSPAGPAPITTTSKRPHPPLAGATTMEAYIAPGDDRLRRGRFVGAVASRGAGGLVKPRQNHKCEQAH